MPITSEDLKLMASARMDDSVNGGGLMSGTVVQDGADNNVFPDVSGNDRLYGRAAMRKLYFAILNNDLDTLYGASVIVDREATDPAVQVVIARISTPRLGNDRPTEFSLKRKIAAQLIAMGQQTVLANSMINEAYDVQGYWDVVEGMGDQLDDFKDLDVPSPIAGYLERDGSTSANQLLARIHPGGVVGDNYKWLGRLVVVESAEIYDEASHYGVKVTSAPGLYRSPVPPYTSGVSSSPYQAPAIYEPSGLLNFYGLSRTTSPVDDGDNVVSVASLFAKIVPYAGDAYPPRSAAEQLGIDPYYLESAAGRVPILRANDVAILHHTATTAPAAVIDGQTVNVGRADLALLRVLDATGALVAQFVAGVAVPGDAAIMGDPEAGTVEFVDTTGLAQPVTIEHRIEHSSLVTAIDWRGAVTLSVPATRSFPTGSALSGAMPVGDRQASVSLGFAQQAWTREWADARIGNDINADFNQALHPVEVTNLGAISERWLIIFGSATTFRLIGEEVGEIGAGSTLVDFAPINPVTNAPYFVMRAAGWGSGWGLGNVWRHDTLGAHPAFWALRCIDPSAPGGTDQAFLQLRGDVGS